MHAVTRERLQPSGLPSGVPHKILSWKHRRRIHWHLDQMAMICELTVYIEDK